MQESALFPDFEHQITAWCREPQGNHRGEQQLHRKVAVQAAELGCDLLDEEPLLARPAAVSSTSPGVAGATKSNVQSRELRSTCEMEIVDTPFAVWVLPPALKAPAVASHKKPPKTVFVPLESSAAVTCVD